MRRVCSHAWVQLQRAVKVLDSGPELLAVHQRLWTKEPGFKIHDSRTYMFHTLHLRPLASFSSNMVQSGALTSQEVLEPPCNITCSSWRRQRLEQNCQSIRRSI